MTEHARDAREKGSRREEEVAQEVEDERWPSAVVIHEVIRHEGVEDLARTASALLLSGLAAGLSMGFSLIVTGVLQARLPDAPWRSLVSGWGYTIGFLIAVMGRQQLFTETTLTPVLPLLHDRTPAVLGRLLRLWSLVLAANLAGTVLVAFALAHAEVFEDGVKASFVAVSRHAIAHPVPVTFLKAIFAGWLLALMVWLLPSSGGARPFVIMILTYIIAVCEFTHVVAGSVDTAYLVFLGEASWSDYVVRFFLPTLSGNVFGGVTLVAVLNWGQVAPDME
ncbi:Inner membrane protein YfdC [Methylobacterium crusticola]|uniref:Inner membrane protein YfdC n=1 Tax=Methylobacterium crusticola TaxID=1697972 RepID=A0ABQ4QQY2_9HYPH|nr:formate/nitrite transporter family protein [Methylobacterium crusticola]GJD47683.1 Inner membrane protein YfdC [Methylobacterium crusticola]